MKIRNLSHACRTRFASVPRATRVTTAVALAAVLIAGCTAVYKNADTCEQTMRSKLADASPDTLKIAHTGVGIDGTRVVVEGALEHVMSASEVAVADAASAASAARAARAADRGVPARASGASAASGAGAAKAAARANLSTAASTAASGAASNAGLAGGETAASNATAVTAPSAAETASTASAVQVVSQKSGKPRMALLPAAGECTFSGNGLLAFHWLAPAKLASPPSEASDAAE